ncbi:MAG: SDR family NAD(P)-dependent oxidoreductase [Chloroflexota bacterium]|nr:SDR family NAD(P)-dependent oxidoreductase [Chloroflexota bacterium]
MQEPNPAITWGDGLLDVPTALTPWTPVEGRRVAGVSSFGISGTNAHVVLEQAPGHGVAGSETTREWHVLPLSARTPLAVERAAARLADHLEAHPGLHLADVAYTLQTGRKAFSARRAVVVDSHAAAIQSLRTLTHADRPAVIRGNRALDARLLAQAWERGEDVDWMRLYVGERRRRVPLTTYPFERERFWIDPPDATGARPLPHSEQWFHAPVWAPAPLPATEPAPLVDGLWLLFADATGVGDRLGRRLQEIGADVAWVRPASDAFKAIDSRHFVIRPGSQSDYRKLLAHLPARRSQVVHLWALDGSQPRPLTAEGFHAAQAHGFYSLLYLAQGLGQYGAEGRLTVVTDGLQPVTGEVAHPEHAPLAAVTRTIPQEFPALRSRVVDVDAASPAAIEDVLTELLADPSDPTVAYRNGLRYVERYVPAKFDAPSPLREHGVYLITGGFGGVGRVVAEYLARRYRARLVLVGRSALTAEKQGIVAGLEVFGAEVLAVSGDAANVEQMKDIVRQTEERFGRVNGVIHAAGITDPRRFPALCETDHETCEAHFRPKVDALLALESALPTGQRAPDFCLLFSSLSAVLGGIGFGAYAAANHFMDRYVQARALPGRWLSVDWDLWQVGAADGLPSGASLAELAMAPDDGVRAFEQALSSRAPHLVQSSVDLDLRLRQWVLLESLGGDTGLRIAHARPSLETEFVPANNEVHKRIAAIWQAALGIDRVGVHDNFFDLGGNSLIGLQVVARVQRELKLPISVLTLFEAPTISSLAKKLQPEASPRQELAEQALAERRKQARRTAGDQAIAIVSMAGRFPGANSVDEFWDNLCQGRESISFFTDEELESEGLDPRLIRQPNYVKARPIVEGADLFDAGFFGFSPREAELLDPQHRLFLECCWEALELVGYDPLAYEGLVGVFAGANISTYLLNYWTDPHIVRSLDPFEAVLASDKDALPTTVSYKLNLRGPSLAVQTFCSTSLVATHLACQSLLNGESDLALAGGSSVRVPRKQGYLYSEGGQESPDGHCRTFDARAQGSLFGDGAAVVVLKRLSDALADGDAIHAVIKGSAVNNDGSLKVGYTAPSVVGQAEAIATALERAGTHPETIGYVEAHGTATPIGDPIEVASLTRAYRRFTDRVGFCAIGSAKTNVGHLDRAAGVTGLIKATLAVQHGLIPANLHYDTPNPELDLLNSPFYVADRLACWQQSDGPRRAAVNSLGVGGTNAHVIVEQAPEPQASGPSRSSQVVLLSARTPTALETATGNLATYLRTHSEAPLADVSYTLAVGRHDFEYRRSVVCHDTADTLHALESSDQRQLVTHRTADAERPVAFLFAGVGDQYVGMGHELYTQEPAFREALDRCSEILQPYVKKPLGELLYGQDQGPELRQRLDVRRNGTWEARPLQETAVAQPVMFAVEYALARLLMSWGIQPQAMVGYSLGEYVAACLAGVMSLEDALKLVAERGRLIQSAPDGAMLAVMLSAEEVQPLLSDEVCLAIDNGSKTCVLAGTTQAIADLDDRLTREGLACRRLATTHAFHSSLLEPLAEQVTALASSVQLNPPRVPYLSNVTGTWITDAQATDPAYWAQHMLRTVRFGDALGELLSEPDRVLVEIGPGIALGSFARQHPRCGREQMSSIVPTLRAAHDRQSDVAAVLGSLARLWLLGVTPDWQAVYKREQRRRLALPTYPFERQRYWLAPRARPALVVAAAESSAGPAASAPERMAILPRRPLTEWLYLPAWRQTSWPARREGEAAWLVFADDSELSQSVLTQLERREHALAVVTPGPAFSQLGSGRYVIRPEVREDYVRLLRELQLGGRQLPLRIVHLWSPGVKGVDQVLERGLYSLMYLAQAFGEVDSPGCELSVVTAAGQSVTGAEHIASEQALLMGAVRVIPLEYEGVACRCIDVESNDVAVDRLLCELESCVGEPLLALRGRSRWVQSFEPIVAPEPKPPLPLGEGRGEGCSRADKRLRTGGVYLITGGLGGLGLAVAEHLAARYQAKQTLVARSGLTVERAGRVQRLEELGAEVLVIAADVTDTSAMRGAIDQTVARYGALNGVIHAAGLPGVGLIQNKTREQARAVLAPKVHGTLALADALKDVRLDFLVLFSSITSLTGGGPGQLDYCAANAFLGAVAQHRAGEQPFTVAIDWSEWRWNAWEHGLEGLQPELQTWMRSNRERVGIDFAEGCEILERVLEDDLSHVVVSSQSFPELAEAARSFTVRSALEWGRPSEAGEARAAHPRPNLATSYVAPRDEFEQRIARVWGDVLRMVEVGIDDNFFDLGGNSLIGLDLIARLRRELRSDSLPAHLLYEAPTVSALARLLHREEPDTTIIADRQARGEKRRASLAQREHQRVLLGGRTQ